MGTTQLISSPAFFASTTVFSNNTAIKLDASNALGVFQITQAVFPAANTDGSDNYVARWGYNITASGGNLDAAKPAVFMAQEARWLINGTPNVELHLGYRTTTPTEYRVFSFAASNTDDTISASMRFSDMTWAGKGGNTALTITTTNSGSFQSLWSIPVGTVFEVATNNVAVFQQRNAANSSYLRLPFINSSDQIEFQNQVAPAASGSISAPNYAIKNNDPNTGMYQYADDAIGWTCGGVEKMRLTSALFKVTAVDIQMTNGYTLKNVDGPMYIDCASGQSINLRPNNSSQCAAFSSVGLTMTEARNFLFGTTTGTKIGTDTAQKIGFWNATPVVQQVFATGASHTVDELITLLQTLGLCKQS